MSVLQFVRLRAEYGAGESSYSELETYITIPQASDESTQTGSQMRPGDEMSADGVSDGGAAVVCPGQTNEKELPDLPVVDFEALRALNPDIVGWIYIEGTNINYPIVQGDDNSYYLKHLFDKSYNSAGCIFLDVRNGDDFEDANSIIYGHHLKQRGTMFTQLKYYKEQAFYDGHKTAILLTPERGYMVELFAGYVTDTAADAWKTDFSDGSFNAWVEDVMPKSYFASGIVPEEGDRILTLSTCTYEFKDARFVVHGIIVE